MSELVRPLVVIETEINYYKRQTAEGIIEVGKRLLEAKDQLQHGQWMNWLSEKVNFSDRQANRFMKVASEFPNTTALANLGQSKVFALLDLPQADRDEFIKTKHQVNGEEKTIDEMTSRELQKTIKENKRLQEERDAALLQRDQKDMENKVLNFENTELRNAPKQVITQPIEVKPSDYDTMKNRLERLEMELKTAKQETREAKNETKAYKTSFENATTGGTAIDAISIPNFKLAVRNFLQHVTPLKYMSDKFIEITAKERMAFMDEIETIELCIYDLKNAIEGSGKGDNLYVIERGQVR